jgi:hypothetical protein
MILLNFGRKLGQIGFEQFKQMTGFKITEQVMLPLEYITIQEFVVELDKSFKKLKLTDEELSQDRVVINPSLNQNAMSVLIAILLQKTGKLPFWMISRPSLFGVSLRSDLFEVIDLQAYAEKKPAEDG